MLSILAQCKLQKYATWNDRHNYNNIYDAFMCYMLRKHLSMAYIMIILQQIPCYLQSFR